MDLPQLTSSTAGHPDTHVAAAESRPGTIVTHSSANIPDDVSLQLPMQTLLMQILGRGAITTQPSSNPSSGLSCPEDAVSGVLIAAGSLLQALGHATNVWRREKQERPEQRERRKSSSDTRPSDPPALVAEDAEDAEDTVPESSDVSVVVHAEEEFNSSGGNSQPGPSSSVQTPPTPDAPSGSGQRTRFVRGLQGLQLVTCERDIAETAALDPSAAKDGSKNSRQVRNEDRRTTPKTSRSKVSRRRSSRKKDTEPSPKRPKDEFVLMETLDEEQFHSGLERMKTEADATVSTYGHRRSSRIAERKRMKECWPMKVHSTPTPPSAAANSDTDDVRTKSLVHADEEQEEDEEAVSGGNKSNRGTGFRWHQTSSKQTSDDGGRIEALPEVKKTRRKKNKKRKSRPAEPLPVFNFFTGRFSLD